MQWRPKVMQPDLMAGWDKSVLTQVAQGRADGGSMSASIAQGHRMADARSLRKPVHLEGGGPPVDEWGRPTTAAPAAAEESLPRRGWNAIKRGGAKVAEKAGEMYDKVAPKAAAAATKVGEVASDAAAKVGDTVAGLRGAPEPVPYKVDPSRFKTVNLPTGTDWIGGTGDVGVRAATAADSGPTIRSDGWQAASPERRPYTGPMQEGVKRPIAGDVRATPNAVVPEPMPGVDPRMTDAVGHSERAPSSLRAGYNKAAASLPGRVVGGAAKFVGKALPYVAPAVMAYESAAPDSTQRYEARFPGLSADPNGSTAGNMARFGTLRALGAASDLGNALTMGASGAITHRDNDTYQSPAAAAAPAAATAAAKAGAAPAAKPVSDEELLATIEDHNNNGDFSKPIPANVAAAQAEINRRDGNKTVLVNDNKGQMQRETESLRARNWQERQDALRRPVDPMNDRAARRAMYAQQDAAAKPADTGPTPFDESKYDLSTWAGMASRGRDLRQFNKQQLMTEARRANIASEANTRRGQQMTYSSSLRGQDLQNDASLRGNDVTREGHYMTAATAKQAALQAKSIADRQYQFEVAKHGNEVANKDLANRQAAEDKLATHLASGLPPTADGKPDLAAVATHINAVKVAYTDYLENAKQELAKNPNDAAAQQRYQTLVRDGLGALPSHVVGVAIRKKQVEDVANANHSTLNPLGGRGAVTNTGPAYLQQEKHVWRPNVLRGYDKEGNASGHVVNESDLRGNKWWLGATDTRYDDLIKKEK